MYFAEKKFCILNENYINLLVQVRLIKWHQRDQYRASHLNGHAMVRFTDGLCIRPQWIDEEAIDIITGSFYFSINHNIQIWGINAGMYNAFHNVKFISNFSFE